MDDDCRKHDHSELLTNSERIALLEHCVGVLQDQVTSLTQQLIIMREVQPREISDAVNDAVDVMDVAMADLWQRVEERLNEFTRRLNEAECRIAVLDAYTKQTIRHGMDNDTDLADIKRRLDALERQQTQSDDALIDGYRAAILAGLVPLDDPEDVKSVADIINAGGGFAWGGLE